MSTANEHTFVPLFEEIFDVKQTAYIQIDKEWEPHPTFTDHYKTEYQRQNPESKRSLFCLE